MTSGCRTMGTTRAPFMQVSARRRGECSETQASRTPVALSGGLRREERRLAPLRRKNKRRVGMARAEDDVRVRDLWRRRSRQSDLTPHTFCGTRLTHSHNDRVPTHAPTFRTVFSLSGRSVALPIE